MLEFRIWNGYAPVTIDSSFQINCETPHKSRQYVSMMMMMMLIASSPSIFTLHFFFLYFHNFIRSFEMLSKKKKKKWQFVDAIGFHTPDGDAVIIESKMVSNDYKWLAEAAIYLDVKFLPIYLWCVWDMCDSIIVWERSKDRTILIRIEIRCSPPARATQHERLNRNSLMPYWCAMRK